MSQTCYEVIANAVDRENGKIVHLTGKISYKKFLHDVDAFAYSLTEHGFCRGDVLTIYLPTCPQAVVAFYACSKIGVVANIVHPLTPFELLKQNVAKTHSKGIVFYDILTKDQRIFANLNQSLVIRASVADYAKPKIAFSVYARFKSKRIKNVCDYLKFVSNDGTTPVLASGSDVVCTMHSGGTSGAPKIVQLTNDNFNCQAESLRSMYLPEGVSADEYSLVTLPIFHAFGLGVSVHTCMSMGYSLCLVPKFTVKGMIHAVRHNNVTFMAVVPVMLKKLMAKKHVNFKPFRSVKVIWCGGESIHEPLIASVNDAISKVGGTGYVMRGYGLTEVTGVCAVNNYQNYRTGSVGKPVPDVRVEIWNDNGECLPSNTIGDIMIAGPTVMKGYLDQNVTSGDTVTVKNEPNVTETDISKYVRDMGFLPPDTDDDGKIDEKSEDVGIIVRDGVRYVPTGDIGYLDEDGFLFLLDRKKRSFKISAVNVFPAEIESTVEKLDYVDEACAVDVKVGGKRFIKVYVTLTTQKPSAVVERDVIELCKKQLMKYSVPTFVQIIDKMPRTNMGKTDYRRLQTMNKQ